VSGLSAGAAFTSDPQWMPQDGAADVAGTGGELDSSAGGAAAGI
jgi:hypothetical protein